MIDLIHALLKLFEMKRFFEYTFPNYLVVINYQRILRMNFMMKSTETHQKPKLLI